MAKTSKILEMLKICLPHFHRACIDLHKFETKARLMIFCSVQILLATTSTVRLAWHWTEYSLNVLIGSPDIDWIFTPCTVGLAWHQLNIHSVYRRISPTLTEYSVCVLSDKPDTDWIFSQCTLWLVWHRTEYSLSVLLDQPDSGSNIHSVYILVHLTLTEYWLSVLSH